MKYLKIMGVIGSIALLLFIVYFDLISKQKPEYWTLIRSLLGLIIAILVVIYIYSKQGKNN